MFSHHLLSLVVVSEPESASPGLHQQEEVPSSVVGQAWTPWSLTILEQVDPRLPVAFWLGYSGRSPGFGPASGVKFWVALHMEA